MEIKCHQKLVREANLKSDIEKFDLTQDEIVLLTFSDFTFKRCETEEEKAEVRQYIKDNEYLGTTVMYSTHYYACYYKGIICGAEIFSLPNAFSKMLGEETRKLERLISRGACSSFTPIGLASNFLMWCIKDMVAHTTYRLFVGYADPNAAELGTIYSALNFYYLGQSSGTTQRYINPYTGKVVSDRFFRVRSAYKKYAKELGFTWQKNWTNERNTGMDWNNIPDEMEKALRQKSKDVQASAERIEYPSKHKFAFVLGQDKRETRQLRKLFTERNKTFPYPKVRGT